MLKLFIKHVEEVDQQSNVWLLRLVNGWKLRFKPNALKDSLEQLRKGN